MQQKVFVAQLCRLQSNIGFPDSNNELIFPWHSEVGVLQNKCP